MDWMWSAGRQVLSRIRFECGLDVIYQGIDFSKPKQLIFTGEKYNCYFDPKNIKIA